MKSSLMPPLTARARLQPGDLHSAQRKAPSGCSSAVFLLAPGALADWKSILVQSIPWPVCTGKTFELKRLARLHKDPTGFPSKAASCLGLRKPGLRVLVGGLAPRALGMFPLRHTFVCRPNKHGTYTDIYTCMSVRYKYIHLDICRLDTYIRTYIHTLHPYIHMSVDLTSFISECPSSRKYNFL